MDFVCYGLLIDILHIFIPFQSENLQYTGKEMVRIFFILFYTVIIGSGLVGNLCVVVAIYRHKRLRTPVHIFLGNVSLSDLLFIVLSAWNAAEFIVKEWTFGDVVCRLQGKV